MSCEECGGVLPLKPYVWICWADDAHDWCDHQFCSAVCRDQWLRRRFMQRVCHRCQLCICPEDRVFRYVPLTGRSEPFHKECI